MSCLLSFINNITLNNKAKQLLCDRKKKKTDTDYFSVKLYQKEIDDKIILWHLDESYYDFVKVLLNRIKIEFIREIVYIQDSYKIPDYITGSIFCIERRDRNPHVQ